MVPDQFALLKLRQNNCAAGESSYFCAADKAMGEAWMCREVWNSTCFTFIFIYGLFTDSLSLLHAELGDRKNSMSERHEFHWWIIILLEAAEVVYL
jgi:hypothetical protein